jgi:probable HAF family extracellular repeat protein
MQMMKRITTSITAGAVLAAFALAQPAKPGYTVIDLGLAGNSPGAAYAISSNSLVAGGAATTDGTAMHAMLWYRGQTFDLGKAGVGRPNSVANGGNDLGQVVGQADTTTTNGADDFCGFNADGFKSITACIPFLWQNGIMKPLPTLGGANGLANKINNRGQAVGLAETSISDAGCPVARFEPVVWEYGGVRRLSISVPGTSDTYGLAAAINDNGQVAGASGTCGPFNSPAQSYLIENHALLWDRDGTPHDLGNLGGMGGLAGNHACAVNNRGQVAGHSVLTNDPMGPFHGFLWTESMAMKDLGTLTGDFASLANGINDRGEVVGASIGPGFSTFTAVLWGSSGISDLNQLVTLNPAKLYLLMAFWINSGGEIVGLAAAADGAHAFLATPNSGRNLAPELRSVSRPVLDGHTRELVMRRSGIRLP